VADPDIWLGGAHHVVDQWHSARGGWQCNMFCSISRLFIYWRGKKSIAKLDGAMDGFVLAGSATVMVYGWRTAVEELH